MALRIIKERHPVNENVKVPLWANIIGSGLFTGYAPIASGTVGSFLALIIYLLPHVSELFFLSLLIAVFFPLGLHVSEIMRQRFGEDPYEVTIDEVVGQWLTYLIGSIVFEIFFKFKSFDPDFQMATKVTFGIVGLLLFRFFDIIKLEPAKYFDNKDSGFGIMMDDIISAFYAGILSSVVTHFIWFKFLAKYL
jgi:phosphatidylglycerophosphatase A